MREGLPENGIASERKGALNAAATPLGDGEQGTLVAPDARYRIAASRMAALAHDAARASGFSHGAVASLVGKDGATVSRLFSADDPSNALQVLAAVLHLDHSNVWLRGVAALRGCELVERPRLTPEQERDRLLETLRRHGAMGRALIDEAFGEAP